MNTLSSSFEVFKLSAVPWLGGGTTELKPPWLLSLRRVVLEPARLQLYPAGTSRERKMGVGWRIGVGRGERGGREVANGEGVRV